MNQNANNNSGQTKPANNNPQQRPQNKDDIDSRSGEEQLTKGTDVTHNKREHQSERKNLTNEE